MIIDSLAKSPVQSGTWEIYNECNYFLILNLSDIHNNSLTGPIPSEIGNSVNLTKLYLFFKFKSKYYFQQSWSKWEFQCKM